LLSNGEELGFAIKASEVLNAEGFDTRIVSIPCMQNYLDHEGSIIPNRKVIAISFGVSDYYYRFTKNVIGINEFGKSAKKEDILDYFGFTTEKIVQRIKEIVGDKHE
jgi:transketolase